MRAPGMMRSMKLLGGFLMAMGALLIWTILSEYWLAAHLANQPLILNWPDFWQVAGYLGFGVLMVVLGIVMRRRKPKNWIW
jgi:hypothetical protein